MIISRSILLRTKNVAEKVAEKIKTHVICSTIFFSENHAFYDKTLEKYGTATQDTDNNIIGRMRIAYRIRNVTDFFKDNQTSLYF
jgi:hypothetical protein